MPLAGIGAGHPDSSNTDAVGQTDDGEEGYAYDQGDDPRFNPPPPPVVEHSLDPYDRNGTETGGGHISGLPVCLPNEELFHVTGDKCRDALLAAHEAGDKPHVYSLDGGCALIADGENGKCIRGLFKTNADVAVMKDVLSRTVRFYANVRGGRAKTMAPPRDVALNILADPGLLPKLAGIATIPALRPDGSILDRPGYDAATGLYYDPSGLGAIQVPETPTKEDLRKALAVLEEPFKDFSFKSVEDRANYLALLLTPVVRSLISGNVPLHVIDAPIQGTGKTTLAACVSLIATGRSKPMPPPGRAGDEEMRKLVTAELVTHPSVTILDNLAGRLDSPALAAALTTGIWSDRLLGHTVMITVSVKTVFIVTGVNVEVAGDMIRRCVWIQLDPTCEKPWERRFAFEPVGYVAQRRAALAGALLTLARNWFARGRPAWRGTPFGSFENWSEVVGGILQAAGMPGFLENRSRADDSANREIDTLAAFYQAWRTAFGDAPKRPSEVIAALSQGSVDYSHTGKPLRDNLPEDLLPMLDRREGGAAAKLGRWLKTIKGRQAGGLMLVDRFDSANRSTYWSVVEAGPDTSAAGVAHLAGTAPARSAP